MIRRWPIATLTLLLTACGADARGPVAVARSFWKAAQAGESDRVRGLASTASTTAGLLPGGRARFDDLVLAEPRIQGDGAVVQTAMTLRHEDGRSLRITFPTHLVREAGVWKVALDETMTAAMWSTHGATMTDSARSEQDSLLARDTAR